ADADVAAGGERAVADVDGAEGGGGAAGDDQAADGGLIRIRDQRRAAVVDHRIAGARGHAGIPVGWVIPRSADGGEVGSLSLKKARRHERDERQSVPEAARRTVASHFFLSFHFGFWVEY